MAIAGKVAITPKGEWNAQTAYTKLDLVFYENASYVAIQPSTGVEPTNTSYWMLMVQSAGGADLEAIIDGTQQVGNAKTLDGHEAEHFVPLSELAKYFKNTGGAINGNVKVYTAEDTYRVFTLENGTRTLEFALYAEGAFRLQDITNSKNILLSTADGTTTLNGTASGNLPINGGGTVKKEGDTPLVVENTKEGYSYTYIGYKSANGINYMGFNNGKPYVYGQGDILHTGNKPTGTYTGNGDATARTIATGGIGNAALIYRSGEMYIVTASGVLKVNSSGVSFGTSASFVGGTLKISSANEMNASGNNYTYQVL